MIESVSFNPWRMTNGRPVVTGADSNAVPGASQKGVFGFTTATNVGLSFGAFSASPYASWIQCIDSREGQAGFYPLALQPSGAAVLVGHNQNLSNGLIQLPTHTTPGGGVGFYDFSLYRAGAQLAALNASLSISGQCVPGYGSFALPALVPGDSGNGLYCEDPGGGRVLYFKGYSGRSAFRNSANTGNILALSDAGPDSSTGYMVNGTQVVGPKVAGWTAATGHTIRRGLNIPTAGLTETMDVLATLINDLRAHGLI